MYQDIMNRPMFQTPQQRQGAGIMAGVAPTTPIRGYADGDLVEDDDSMIASLLSQAEELPEAFSNLTMEDAVGYVKENPEILLAAIPGLGIGGVALRFGPGAARSAISLGKRLLTKKKAPKATEADIMGNVPARKAPKGLSAEQQAEGIMGLPTKAAGSAVSKLDKAKAVGKQVGSGISKVIRNPIKSTVAGTGIYALAQQFPDLELDKLMDQPEVRALYETLPEGLRDIISPDVGERVKFTDPAAKRLDEAKKAKAAGMSVSKYANKVLKEDSDASTRTKRQASLAKTLRSFHAGGGLTKVSGYKPVLGNNKFGYPSGGVSVKSFRRGGATTKK